MGNVQESIEDGLLTDRKIDLEIASQEIVREESKSGNGSNIYETSYSKYLQHQNIGSPKPSPRDNAMEFEKLDGIDITDDDEDQINNEIDINQINVNMVS